MTWAELETDAPEIAQRGRECLERVGVALLGTLRADGWPRISPVEAYAVGGELVIGLMPRSLKVGDLARDSRCTLQSAVTDPHSGEAELKLYCRARELHDLGLRNTARGAWWVDRPRGDARVFALEIEEAALVSWDTARGEMTVHSWSPSRGARKRTRPYP